MDPPQMPAAPRPAAPGPAKKSVVAKMAGAITNHAHLSLAIIIVLVILVVGGYIYYHGLFFLGPYAKHGKPGRREKKNSKRKNADEAASDADADKGDPETEKLIDSINGN